MNISKRSNYLLLVMMQIVRNRRVAITQRELCSIAKISVATLRKSIAELKAEGLLKTEVVKGFRKNFFSYTIIKEVS